MRFQLEAIDESGFGIYRAGSRVLFVAVYSTWRMMNGRKTSVGEGREKRNVLERLKQRNKNRESSSRP